MLSHLTVNDVVLIHKLALPVQAGLSVLTGETGAGKSILLDALGISMGGRSEARLVSKGAEKAVVTAVFDLSPDHPVQSILKDNDIEAEDQLILKRVVGADGKSKAFLNDQPVSVSLLKSIGDLLIEIHGQFETQGLLDPKTHRGILDSYAGLESEAEDLKQAWDEWQKLKDRLARLAADVEKAKSEEVYLRNSIEDLADIDPQIGEEAILTERRVILMNSEQILQAFQSVHDHVTSDNGVEDRINQACRALERVADKAGERVNALVQMLDRALSDVRDVVGEIESLSYEMGGEGQSLEEVDDRLQLLRGQCRKHGCIADELPQKLEELREQLSFIEDQDHAGGVLAQKEQQAKKRYIELAEALSEKRKAAATIFSRAVNAELAPLKLERAEIFMTLERMEESQWQAYGMDKVHFTISTNPGQDPGPLNKIASGGELSRFMLAFKVVMAGTGTACTMIFDEIDAGVGGSTADAIGERLARLAKDKQILVVTHSPQVAARSNHHWIVSKAPSENGKIETLVTPLKDSANRREEIARMLAGAQITDEARAAADQLLKSGRAA